MSALDQKQTFVVQNVMSALPSTADIRSAQAYVGFVPIADVTTFALMPPFAACVTPNPHSASSMTLSSLSGPGPASTTTTSMTR
jgi:hypothetical protein